MRILAAKFISDIWRHEQKPTHLKQNATFVGKLGVKIHSDIVKPRKTDFELVTINLQKFYQPWLQPNFICNSQ